MMAAANCFLAALLPHSVFALEQIEAICIAAIKNNRNGQLLADYIRLMARCGSRASETLRLMWSDVDWGQQQLTIGSDGLSKNHESRAVDFNAALAELLEDMRSRSNGSAYLFPAPRMFGEDAPRAVSKKHSTKLEYWLVWTASATTIAATTSSATP